MGQTPHHSRRLDRLTIGTDWDGVWGKPQTLERSASACPGGGELGPATCHRVHYRLGLLRPNIGGRDGVADYLFDLDGRRQQIGEPSTLPHTTILSVKLPSWPEQLRRGRHAR